jgi:hypothetical protein
LETLVPQSPEPTDQDKLAVDIEKTRKEIAKLDAETKKLQHDVAQSRKTGLEKVFDWMTKGGAAGISLVGLAAGIFGLTLSGERNNLLKDQIAVLETKKGGLTESVRAGEEQMRTLVATNEQLSRNVESQQVALKAAQTDWQSLQQQIKTVQAQIPKDAPAQQTLERASEDSILFGTALAAAARATPNASGSLDVQASANQLRLVFDKLFAQDSRTRVAAYAELMEKHATNKDLPRSLMAYSRDNWMNENGVYNSLVVLSHLNLNRLGPDIAAVRQFATDAAAIGPRTAQRASIVLDRL